MPGDVEELSSASKSSSQESRQEGVAKGERRSHRGTRAVWTSQPFRLLYLHPLMDATTEEDFKYNLVTCDRKEMDSEKAPEYIAINAEPEADETFDHMILCDGKEVPVTENTHCMLLQLRALAFQNIWYRTLCVGTDGRSSITDFSMLVCQKALYAFDKSFRELTSPSRPNFLTQNQHATSDQGDMVHLLQSHPPVSNAWTVEISTKTTSLTSNSEYSVIHIKIPPNGPDTAVWGNGQLQYLPWSIVSALQIFALVRPRLPWVGDMLFVPQLSLPTQDRRHTLLSEIERRAKQVVHVEQSFYEYSKLEDPRRNFRLLRLIPHSRPLEPILAEVITTSYGDAPRYTVLSYCWGSTKRSERVMLSGAYIDITESLNLALRELLRYGDKYVWADAICINQADPAERSE